ncbi:helix-turn-helix domain-containing protein [Bacillus sp. z60-18]|uniref:helix-turn-helix domain-containing protein n=1 Tax=Bacillus TaxID=1386 RepID=UPI00098B32EB
MPILSVLFPLLPSPIKKSSIAAWFVTSFNEALELTGLSPKKLSKAARFNQVRLRIFFTPEIDLHDCMHEFGYYDYAHFSKDFKECIGLIPNEYRNWMLEKMNREQHKHENVVFLQDE